MSKRLASEHGISQGAGKVYSSRACIPQAVPSGSPSLESQASPISDLWSMSGCSPASKGNGSSKGNSPTFDNQPPCPPTTGTQGIRSSQFPGDDKEFFKSLGNCWKVTTVDIFNPRGPVGESSAGGSRGFIDPNDVEQQPTTSLKVNVPVGNRGAFFRVLAVVEVLTKMGIRLVRGTCEDEGPELSFVFEVENARNRALLEEMKIIERRFEWDWPLLQNMGKWDMMYKKPMADLKSLSKSELTAMTVAGMDSLGVLHKISEKLHEAHFDIVATALRTQGLWPTGRFACVFYVKAIEGKTLTDNALNSIKAELEYMRGENFKLEVTYGERLSTPEMWLNWELSRHAYPKPDMEMPEDVSLEFVSPEPSWPGWKMVLGCTDSPHVVFDILCTLYFRGYKVVQNSNFKIHGSEERRRVYMEYYLQLQDSWSPLDERDVVDIRGHLALAFYRRRTKDSERFEVNAMDKPGVLHKVSKLFHDSWWSVTRADVEIMGSTAKTIIYAIAGCSMSEKLETLRQGLSKLFLEEDRPPRSKPIDIIR